MGDPDTLADPLLQRALAVLLALLRLKTVKGWKCVQLAVVALHNAGARSAGLERHCVERGLCGSLLDIANAGMALVWPWYGPCHGVVYFCEVHAAGRAPPLP